MLTEKEQEWLRERKPGHIPCPIRCDVSQCDERCEACSHAFYAFSDNLDFEVSVNLMTAPLSSLNLGCAFCPLHGRLDCFRIFSARLGCDCQDKKGIQWRLLRFARIATEEDMDHAD